jgi:UDP-glucose 4-epimerase
VSKKENLSALVIGGAGFIGSHLVDELIDSPEFQKVVVLDNFFLGDLDNLSEARKSDKYVLVRGDATDISTILKVVDSNKSDVIFNLGVTPLPNSLDFPYWSSKINMDIALAVCEVIRLLPQMRLVHCSSSEVYGTLVTSPMSESHSCIPETPYAASKYAGDVLVQSYVRTFGIHALIVRPFNNYGPRQNTREYKGIFPSFAEAIYRRKPLIITGTGSQSRDFVYVKDTSKAIYLLSLLGNFDSGDVTNIGTGIDTSMITIANKVIEMFDYSEIGIEFVKSRSGDVSKHVGSFEKLLGVTNFMPLAIGDEQIRITIESLIDFIEKNQK